MRSHILNSMLVLPESVTGALFGNTDMENWHIRLRKNNPIPSLDLAQYFKVYVTPLGFDGLIAKKLGPCILHSVDLGICTELITVFSLVLQ